MTPTIEKIIVTDAMLALAADALAKSTGEGSRGGHVIGHTKSGKAIYGPGHKAYQGVERFDEGKIATQGVERFPGWSSKDHQDAQNAHTKAFEAFFADPSKYSSKTSEESQPYSDAADLHHFAKRRLKQEAQRAAYEKQRAASEGK